MGRAIPTIVTEKRQQTPNSVSTPGDIGIAHQPNEYIEISQVDAGQAFIEKLLERLA